MPIASLMPTDRRDQEIFEDHGLANRYLFSGIDNRLLITPFAIDKDFFADAINLLGYRNLVNLNPHEVSESTSTSIINDQSLMDEIVKTIRENPGITIHAHAATPQMFKLTSYLRNLNLKFETPELPQETSFWTTSFFDSKSGFRQISNYMGSDFPKMPIGGICYRKEDIIGWASYLIKNKKGCVMKSDHGQGGLGLKILKTEDFQGKNIDGELSAMIENEAFWLRDTVVVEEFVEPDKNICGGAPNVEAKIDGQVEPLYVCSMRVSDKGIFQGIELGKEAVPNDIDRILKKSAAEFGKLLKDFGYRGFYEIDFVSDKDRNIFPIEANLRRTGGTHSYEFGKYLLGNDFLNKFYMIVNNFVKVEGCKGKTYREIKEIAQTLFYPVLGKQEGVVVTITNLLIQGFIGYIVIAESKNRAIELEKDFIGRFE